MSRNEDNPTSHTKGESVMWEGDERAVVYGIAAKIFRDTTLSLLDLP